MKEAANIMQAYYSSPEGALRQSRIDSYMISSKKNAQWDQKLVKIITELSKLQRQDSTALFSLSRFSLPIRHPPLVLLPPHSILHRLYLAPDLHHSPPLAPLPFSLIVSLGSTGESRGSAPAVGRPASPQDLKLGTNFDGFIEQVTKHRSEELKMGCRKNGVLKM